MKNPTPASGGGCSPSASPENHEGFYVVIDIGCHECGVGHVVVGSHRTLHEALVAKVVRDAETGGTRDGGQTAADVFLVRPPLDSGGTSE